MSLHSLLRKRRNPGPEPDTRRLPTELYLHILSFLPPDTKLYPLLFIDSGFHAEVERQLYSNISFTGDGIKRGNDRPAQRRIKLFKTLARTPRLSHTVHSLTIPPFIFRARTGVEWQDREDRGLQYTYWHLLNLALRAMPNLKEFTLGKFCHHQQDILPGQKFGAIFDECTFRLRSLTILEGESHYVQIPGNYDVFRELEELTIPWVPYGSLDIRVAVTQLTILEISHTAFPSLYLPSSQVKALSFPATHPVTGDVEKWGAHSHPELRSLKISLHDADYDWPLWMLRFTTSFTALRFLHIEVWWWVTTMVRIRETVMPLRVLVQLRKIVFRHAYEYRWDHTTVDGLTPQGLQSKDVAQLFFADIPQLMIARVDVKEWRRDEIGIGKYTTREDQEEWKDKAWWN